LESFMVRIYRALKMFLSCKMITLLMVLVFSLVILSDINFLCSECPADEDPTSESSIEARYAKERQRMVKEQLEAPGRDIKNKKVLEAMMSVPRHKFVPEHLRAEAYNDHPLPIGHNQTISQPYIVAFMTEAIDPQPDFKVLEIGTGSGYQAAVLAKIVKSVYSIEIIEELSRNARQTLSQLGYTNVFLKVGNGFEGWPENAPYDAIIVTCAPETIPQALIDQLKNGGKMIIPVGPSFNQSLYLIEKKDNKIIKKSVLPVRFVPMINSNRE